MCLTCMFSVYIAIATTDVRPNVNSSETTMNTYHGDFNCFLTRTVKYQY